MSRIVFLLEEMSMKEFLDGFLPREFPGLDFLCVPHQGKQDLEKRLPGKLRAWRTPGDRLVVQRDQDSADCKTLKRRLVDLCDEAGRDDAVVRIACRTLESWYLGDLEAVDEAFGARKAVKVKKKAAYRNPDAVGDPTGEMAKLAPQFQKVTGARRMAATVRRDRNRSRSFQVLMESVEKLAG